jgi:hypothetical protein
MPDARQVARHAQETLMQRLHEGEDQGRAGRQARTQTLEAAAPYVLD